MGSTGIILLRLDNCLASRSYWGLLMLVSYQTYEYIYLLACIYIYISSGFFGSSGLLVIHINSLVSYFWSAHSLFVDAQFSLHPLECSGQSRLAL